MKVESVYKALHALHCLIVSYLSQIRPDRTRENEFSNLKVKPKGQKASGIVLHYRRCEMFVRKDSNWNVVMAGRVAGVVRMYSDGGLTSQTALTFSPLSPLLTIY